MKATISLTLAAIMLALPVAAKDRKDSSLEGVIRDEIRDAIDDDDERGKGRPDNPGEHGRDNAAEKQRQNKGKADGKNDDSLHDRLMNELDDDDDKDKKHKKKKGHD